MRQRRRAQASLFGVGLRARRRTIKTPISPATLAVRRALRLARRNAVGAIVMSALALTAVST